MFSENRILTLFIAITLLSLPAAAGEQTQATELLLGDIEDVRVNLNSWGPHLGFEVVIAGENPRLTPLISMIRGAQPGQGHKCANRGAIRFRLKDGRLIAVGLLPSHSVGFYGLRLYAGERLQGVYRVDREAFLAVLEGLDVPVNDPAFGE